MFCVEAWNCGHWLPLTRSPAAPKAESRCASRGARGGVSGWHARPGRLSPRPAETAFPATSLLDFAHDFRSAARGKFAKAGRLRQRSGRACYPEPSARRVCSSITPVSSTQTVSLTLASPHLVLVSPLRCFVRRRPCSLGSQLISFGIGILRRGFGSGLFCTFGHVSPYFAGDESRVLSLTHSPRVGFAIQRAPDCAPRSGA